MTVFLQDIWLLLSDILSIINKCIWLCPIDESKEILLGRPNDGGTILVRKSLRKLVTFSKYDHHRILGIEPIS